MLDNQVKEQLKNYLAKLVNPIEIVASINDTEKSREMTALLQDIAELSTKITLIEKADDDRRSPSFSINRPDGGVNLRFAGIPMGHEFTSLVLACRLAVIRPKSNRTLSNKSKIWTESTNSKRTFP